jgi:hypothetical protein
MTRRWRFGAFGLVIAVVAVVAASPASAAPPVHAKSVQGVKIPERSRKQIPLIRAADVIRAEVDRGDYPGYAGIELQDAQVAVWWKGEVPEPVSLAIGKARAIAPVRIGKAVHSLRELKAAGVSIQAALAAQQPDIKYAVDGSRVVVAVHDRAGAARQMPRVDVPVQVVDQGQKEDVTREADWAPWSGGARINNFNAGSMCTSGFPVTDGRNRFLLTAGHCGNLYNAVMSGGGTYLGVFWKKSTQHDVALIYPPAGVDPTIYVAGPADNWVVHVDGWDYAYPGEYLCQSGATTAYVTGGMVCDLQVEGFTSDGAAWALQIHGQPAARPGDSGGPVFAWSARGGAIAVGINAWICCGGDILGFAPFSAAHSEFGIWIAQ